jgi:hypothetical protein
MVCARAGIVWTLQQGLGPVWSAAISTKRNALITDHPLLTREADPHADVTD